MTTFARQPDGTWRPAKPLPPASGYDAEVFADGTWKLYRDVMTLVASGRNRTKIGRGFAIVRAMKRDRKATP